MIPDFINVIQKDLTVLASSFRSTPDNRIHTALDKKVALSAIRIISASFIAAGALIAVSGLSYIATNTATCLTLLALGALVYAVARDVFIIAKNMTDQEPLQQPITMVLTGVKYVSDLVTGRKNLNDSPDRLVTYGTFAPAAWSALFKAYPELDIYNPING